MGHALNDRLHTARGIPTPLQLLDRMEEVLAAGQHGFVVDYHSCELFPER